MTGSLSFCPYCGTPVASPDQQFCGSCGGRLAGPGAAQSAGPSTPSMPSARPAPAGPPSVPRFATSQAEAGAASWANIGDAVALAVFPFLVWLAATLITTLLISDAVRSQLYSMPGMRAFGYMAAGVTEGFLSAGTGVIGALLAGLGYQVGASGSAGALGTSTNVSAAFTAGLVPLSTLALFAVTMGRGARSQARRRGGTTLTDYLGPAVLGAAVAGIAIYLGALLLSTSLGGTLDSFTGSLGGGVSVRGGPTISGLLFVLFPTLAIGATVGALAGGGWTLLLARLEPQLAQPSFARVIARLPLLLYGAVGYLAALVVGSVVSTVVLVAMALAQGADLFLLVRLLPAILLLMPNAVAILTLAGTGAQLGLGATGAAAASVPTQTGSLWDLPMEWVVAGLVMLAVPGLIAGVITRARIPAATPGLVAAVGALTGVVALIGASLAVPSFTAQGQVFVSSASGSTKLVFDMGQAVLVGGVAMVGTALVGFQYGGSAATRVPSVPSMPR